jgi:hypothetical protein
LLLATGPGGTASLLLTDSNKVSVLTSLDGGNHQTLANFTLLNSGGTGLVSAGGVPSGTIQLNFLKSSGFSPLFTLGGNPLDAFSIELANTQPSLSSQPGVPTRNPNGTAGSPTETIFLTDQGQCS